MVLRTWPGAIAPSPPNVRRSIAIGDGAVAVAAMSRFQKGSARKSNLLLCTGAPFWQLYNKPALPGTRLIGGVGQLFARMLVADCPPEKIDPKKMAQLIEEEVIPHVEDERGFRGVWFYVNRESGKLFSITLYESEANLVSAQESIKELRSRALGTLGCTPVSADKLEVIASRVP